MDELEKLRREAAEAIKAGADPEMVRHEFRRLAALLPEPQETPEGHEGAKTGVGAFARSALATAANAAQGIPGMEAVQAAARSGARTLASKVPVLGNYVDPQSYGDALLDIRGETGKIPGALRVAGQLPGAVASTAVLPGGAAWKSGAAYGGAAGALDADPNMGIRERAGRAAGGAAVGAFIPKAIEGVANTGRIAKTGVRSIVAPTPAALEQAQKAALKQKVDPLYERARQEGQNAVVPPQVRAFLDRPDVREIVSRLQGYDEFAGMADDAPEMIQAVNQALSEKLLALKKPQQIITDGKGATFTGRAERRQAESLKRELSNAVSTPGQMMGPSRSGINVRAVPLMPSQRVADRVNAQGMAEQQATSKGVNAVAAAERGRAAGGALSKSSPEAYESWVYKAPPNEVDAFMRSVLGETGNKVRGAIKPDPLTGSLAVGLGGTGLYLGGPWGLAGAAVPALMKAGRAATAGDRMLRAAKGLPRSASVPRGVTPTILDLLQEATRDR